jgi:hypothetical protein
MRVLALGTLSNLCFTGHMEKFRAEIFATDSRHKKSARIFISAPRKVIFDLLADPYRHVDFDGSGTLRGNVTGPQRLYLGAKFGMNVTIKINYRTLNTVVEFEENHLIAWRHPGRHRWRYELREVTPIQTEVTETFDGTFAICPIALNLINAYKNNQIAVAKTLVNLKKLAEATYV